MGGNLQTAILQTDCRLQFILHIIPSASSSMHVMMLYYYHHHVIQLRLPGHQGPGLQSAPAACSVCRRTFPPPGSVLPVKIAEILPIRVSDLTDTHHTLSHHEERHCRHCRHCSQGMQCMQCKSLYQTTQSNAGWRLETGMDWREI